MTRVYHRHHCHLYHNQHWISLFPIKNSLECGTKNDNAKFSNIVPQSSLHVNKIRWLNLTFIISQKHGEFPAEIKQFWLEKIINLKIYIKRLKCWRKAIDTQETWMGQTLDNTIWFLVYKIDFSFELQFFLKDSTKTWFLLKQTSETCLNLFDILFVRASFHYLSRVNHNILFTFCIIITFSGKCIIIYWRIFHVSYCWVIFISYSVTAPLIS